MNWVNRLLHFLITRAVLDSSSCEREKTKPSSIFPSSWRTACFSSTLPTPFFFVSYDYNRITEQFDFSSREAEGKILKFWTKEERTLYETQRQVVACCMITVESPYLIIGVPITSRSLSSRTIFWSSFSCRNENVEVSIVASFLPTDGGEGKRKEEEGKKKKIIHTTRRLSAWPLNFSNNKIPIDQIQFVVFFHAEIPACSQVSDSHRVQPIDETACPLRPRQLQPP